uniref:Uncharacterized protein n=1 Tax=Lepeophtheirus salmonis TaxID=72036 RepID=A0A0K2T4H7_LEPSM
MDFFLKNADFLCNFRTHGNFSFRKIIVDPIFNGFFSFGNLRQPLFQDLDPSFHGYIFVDEIRLTHRNEPIASDSVIVFNKLFTKKGSFVLGRGIKGVLFQ